MVAIAVGVPVAIAVVMVMVVAVGVGLVVASDDEGKGGEIWIVGKDMGRIYTAFRRSW